MHNVHIPVDDEHDEDDVDDEYDEDENDVEDPALKAEDASVIEA